MSALKELLASGKPVRNVIWNLLGGLWIGVLIVLATPRYIAMLGMEGYSLVGLWLMMQVMMGILDLGMGATLVREFADVSEEKGGAPFRRDLLRTLETVYWTVGSILALSLALASKQVAGHWLKASLLSPQEISNVIRLIALTLALQFPCTLYSNGLGGLQDHRLMNILQMVGNTLRYGGGVAVLFFRPDPVSFFCVQAFVAGFQTLLTMVVLRRKLSTPNASPACFRLAQLRRLWRFSTGMALTSLAGLLVGNVDRIVLSKMVSTVELGKYSVAFTATGLVQMGIQPFYRAYFPRFAELISTRQFGRLREDYYRGCRLMAMVIIPIAILGMVFASQIFAAWLGRNDPTIVKSFRWLLLGISSAGLMWLPAAFQQAHGWTRLHITMMFGALLAGVPLMLWTIPAFGSPGASVVWVLHGLSDLSLGLWLMHRRLLVNDYISWFGYVVLPPLACSAAVVGVSWWLMPSGLSRWPCLGWIGITGALIIVLALKFGPGGIPQESAPS